MMERFYITNLLKRQNLKSEKLKKLEKNGKKKKKTGKKYRSRT